MGVPRLKKFIKENSEYLSRDLTLNLPNTIIIDGTNVLYEIYHKKGLQNDSENLEKLHDFVSTIKKYVKPIFIFDGGHANDQKFPTMIERRKNTLQKKECIFLSDNWIKILKELDEIQIARCDFEADHEIAKIASAYECPVLSGDSDFYLMDLKHGFILYDDFKWEEAKNGIKCKLYHREFWEKMGVKEECVPYLAAFAGNDIIKPQKPGKVEDIVPFLKKNSLDEVLKYVGAKLKPLISSCYSLPETSLVVEYLRTPDNRPISQLSSHFPDWFIELYRKCEVGKYVVDVVLHKRRFLGHNVGYTDTSLRLRQMQYGILINDSKSTITEYQPYVALGDMASELKEKNVKPITQLQLRNIPNLKMITGMDLEHRKDLFYCFLEIEQSVCEDKIDLFHLPIAALAFWWRNNQFTPVQSKERKISKNHKHEFSQWMAILKHTIYLNQLLKFPITKCDVTVITSKVFSKLFEENKKQRSQGENSAGLSEQEELYNALELFIDQLYQS
ncbi:protein asteroid homolog 1-like [Anneissia japonica]|uniref:protein asteroid homolog 1-like n=1 Tax=Anneissia japonica TaxID=1529436 RepID=UPI0014256E53|nr:protein asteroid homolog 1-like [Anneissia japonica]